MTRKHPPRGPDSGDAMPHAELLRLHEALHLSNLKYKNLFELAPVGYLFLSPSGQVQDANVAAASLFGQPRALLTRAHVPVFIRVHRDPRAHRAP